MRIADFSTANPSAFNASTISTFVTEPNRRPSTPAFCVMFTVVPSSLAACSCAVASFAAAAASSSARFASSILMFSGVARFALPCGIRKLRANPCLTLTTSPRLPTLAIFSSRMICMASLALVEVGVGNQREKAGALDRRAELALVPGLRAGDPRRHDLAVFLDEILQDLDVLVVDFLDAFRGEAAELLALEQRVAALALLAIFLLAEPSLGTGHVSFLPSIRIR